MGSAPSTDALKDKTVVVIGCSFGGKGVAYPLKGKCKLIVIDPREAMHITIGALRATVEPGFTRRTLIPNKDVFGDSFKQGTVQEINPSENTVTLADGEKISYDYLVIATGCRGPFPGKLDNETTVDQAVDLYKNANEKVKAANKIVIIGGGAVGVELAGEIATDYPEKDVTIIHAREYLSEPALNQKFRNAVKTQVEKMKVNLILGEKVANLDELPRDLSRGATIKTNKGKTLEADLVFVCIGMSVNSEAYASSLGSSMDERGSLKVNSYLQVEGHDNIFAAGDCCTAHAMKMAYRAGEQGEIIKQNIIQHVNGQALKPYKPGVLMYAVSLGRHEGVLQLGGCVIGSWLVRRAKTGDMLTGRFWGESGLKVPTGEETQV